MVIRIAFVDGSMADFVHFDHFQELLFSYIEDGGPFTLEDVHHTLVIINARNVLWVKEVEY
jgi:hypothetical protein